MAADLSDFVGPFVRRNPDGSLNFEEMSDLFDKACAVYETKFGADVAMIAAAVDRIYDNPKLKRGASLSLDALKTFVFKDEEIASKLTIDNHQAYTALFESYMSDNTDRNEKKKRGTEEVIQKAEPFGTRKFHAKRGTGGGIVRCADCEKPVD